jgi:hypothetical protein
LRGVPDEIRSWKHHFFPRLEESKSCVYVALGGETPI